MKRQGSDWVVTPHTNAGSEWQITTATYPKEDNVDSDMAIRLKAWTVGKCSEGKLRVAGIIESHPDKPEREGTLTRSNEILSLRYDGEGSFIAETKSARYELNS